MSEKNMNEDYEMTVTLTLDDDTELECEVIGDTFTAGETTYIALHPLDGTEEVFIYRCKGEGEDIQLENIETDEEFEAASEAYDMMLDDMEFDDMLEDGEEE